MNKKTLVVSALAGALALTAGYASAEKLVQPQVDAKAKVHAKAKAHKQMSHKKQAPKQG